MSCKVHGLVQTPGNGSNLQQRRPDALGTSLPSLIPVPGALFLPVPSSWYLYHLRSHNRILLQSQLRLLSPRQLIPSPPITRAALLHHVCRAGPRRAWFQACVVRSRPPSSHPSDSLVQQVLSPTRLLRFCVCTTRTPTR